MYSYDQFRTYYVILHPLPAGGHNFKNYHYMITSARMPLLGDQELVGW